VLAVENGVVCLLVQRCVVSRVLTEHNALTSTSVSVALVTPATTVKQVVYLFMFLLIN